MVRINPTFGIALLFFTGTTFSKNLNTSHNHLVINSGAISDYVNASSNCVIEVNAGFDILTCEGSSLQLMGEISPNVTSVSWESGSGKGEFSDSTLLNPVFTPDPEDYGSTIFLIFTGYDEIAECQEQDLMEITIFNLPQVDAGEDFIACEGEIINLNGFVNEEDYAIEWEGGTGLFSDIFSLETTYQSTIFDPNPLVLTLTARDPIGTCETVKSDITITFLPEPTIFAGSDTVLCGLQALDLSQLNEIPFTENTTIFNWSTTGSGSFDDAQVLTPVYNPAEEDLGSSIILSVEATGDDVCSTVIDELQITIHSDVNVDAGSDEVTFVDEPFDLASCFVQPYAEGFVSLTWSTDGDGQFDDPTVMHPVYTPSKQDKDKAITLTLTAEGYCETIDDHMFLTIESVTGLDPVSKNGTFQVYYNTRHQVLMLSFDRVSMAKEAWYLYDLSGQLIENGILQNGLDQYSISLERPARGVYLFMVDNNTRKLAIYK